MSRSLLEKHKSSGAVKGNVNEFRIVRTGRSSTGVDNLTDTDWEFINDHWNSSLFNQHYMRDDFQRTRSARLAEYETQFQIFLQKFLNLCSVKRHEKFQNFNEDQLLHSWIMPVMECLGWWDQIKDEAIPELTYTIEDEFGKRTYRPDVAFLPDSKLKTAIQEKSPSQRLEILKRYVILTLEAKYWNRIRTSERENTDLGTKADFAKAKKVDSASSLSPGGQILTYLRHLRNDDPVRNHFGVVTDGKVWRLHHVEHSDKQYFEFDLGELFDEVVSKPEITDLNEKQYQCIEEAARYFFYIFSKSALYSASGEPTIADELLAHRKKYIKEASPNLKDRFLNVMKIACNGFDRAFKERGTVVPTDKIRDVSESFIFNVLFLKSCEAKGIIRHEANTEFSITSIIESIAYFDTSPGVDDQTNEQINLSPKFKGFSYKNSGTELHSKIIQLTKTVQEGGKIGGREITAFKETLFYEDELALIEKHHLTNIETVKLLFELGYMDEEGKYRQVPYNIFTPEQLGSIYESFLEFTIQRADADLEYLKKQWKPLSKQTADKLKHRDNVRHPIAKKGELFFTPNNKERKATGSYYTPDHVVKFIVEKTIGPICRGKSPDEIKSLKVCDPAMGSGHFLTESLRFLTDRYLEAMESEPVEKYPSSSQAKRDILDSCIFGVDINPRAVRLAKIALWLETAYSGRKLERLSDQLKCADSLLDENLWKKEWNFYKLGIDAVVGNPPYLGEKGHKEIFRKIASSWLGKQFYMGKMDLLYFFFHLGIDILKDNGRLGFITTNYFTTALGAKKLRSDFYSRTNVDLLLNLNELKVFDDASGQHNMVTLITKTSEVGKTQIISTNESGSCTQLLLQQIVDGKSSKTVYGTNTKEELYEGEAKYLRLKAFDEDSGEQIQSVLKKVAKNQNKLGTLFNVNNGIFTGCDSIKEKNIKKYALKNVKDGDGVFVLTSAELKKLGLSKSEMSLIRPFFKNSDIKKFSTTIKHDLHLINLRYTDRPDLKKYPGLKEHMEKFKKFLGDRPQTGTLQSAFGNNMWYVMSTSRQLDFDGPKIVAPQRSRLNTFGYNDCPWYASADVYFITSTPSSNLELKYILGLLNSKLYYVWLYFRGKRKGETLELYQIPLSEMPIADADIKTQESIVKLVDNLIRDPFDTKSFTKLNTIIYQHYDLNKEEIEAVEEFYDSKTGEPDEEVETKEVA